MQFLFGIIFGLVVGAVVTQLVLNRSQEKNWESVIAERRRAIRRSTTLAQQLSELTAAHKSEIRSLRSETQKESEHHRYLLRRADSALAAAKEMRDQQAQLIAELTPTELTQAS